MGVVAVGELLPLLLVPVPESLLLLPPPAVDGWDCSRYLVDAKEGGKQERGRVRVVESKPARWRERRVAYRASCHGFGAPLYAFDGRATVLSRVLLSLYATSSSFAFSCHHLLSIPRPVPTHVPTKSWGMRQGARGSAAR